MSRAIGEVLDSLRYLGPRPKLEAVGQSHCAFCFRAVSAQGKKCFERYRTLKFETAIAMAVELSLDKKIRAFKEDKTSAQKCWRSTSQRDARDRSTFCSGCTSKSEERKR